MVENQAYLFLVFSFTGVVIGLLFDFFRILRKSFKTSDIITYIEDILFWLLTGILILFNIWYFNNGEIRLFIFLGIIFGIIIYMLTLSTIILKIITFILDKIIKILELPLKSIKYILHKISQKIKSFLEKILQKIKIKKGIFEKNGE